MAKNPLYNTAVYFASDRYDDSVVNDFLYQSLEQSYERCLEAQKSVAMRKEVRGIMDQFTIDVKINSKYKLPVDTYTCIIPSTILPIVDKKRFIQRYKNFQRPISLSEIATDTKTFGNRLMFSTDTYLYMKLDLIETNDRHTILILYPGTTGIPVPTLNDLRDGKKPWCLWTEVQSKIFYTSSLIGTILNSSRTKVTIPASNPLSNVSGRVTDVNAWDIAMTYSDGTGRQLLAVSSATYYTKTGNNVQFTIDPEFGQMIATSNSAVDVYLIHQPDRVSNIIYLNQPDHSPVVTLPYTYNPELSCLSVYEYDKVNHMRKQRLEAVKGTIYYPNVFDFSSLIGENKAMLIEVTEYPKMDSGTKFDCPISMYRFATNNYYPSIITSNDCPAPLKDYVPQKLVMDYADYATSEYFGDIRGYKLDKLRVLQKDNPYINYHLTRMLDDKNRRLYTANGSPTELKFGSPYVTDTSFISVVQPDEVLHFSEPQGYTSIKTKVELPMVFYYLHGEWMLPQHVESQLDITYAFLPKSKIEEAQKMYTDAGLNLSQFNESCPLTVDCLDESTMASSQAITSTMWNQLGQYKTLFDDHDSVKEYSLSDLILYNQTTGEYYDKDKQFSVSLALDEYRVKNDFVDEVVLLDRTTTIEYLLTSLTEIYATKDSQPIVLKVGSVIVPMDPLLENLPNGLSDIDGKKLSKETIQIAIKDPALIGVSVGVALGTRGTTSRIPGTDIIQNNWEVISENFTGVPNNNRIELYFGGTLLLENEAYTLTLPTNVGGDLQVHLKKEYFTAEGLTDEKVQTMDLYINYLPLEMNVVTVHTDTLFEENFLDSELRGPNTWVKTNMEISTFLDGTDATELLIKDSARVFCKGVRIPNSLLLDQYAGNTMNIIPVSDTLYGPTSFVRLKRFGKVVESDDILTDASVAVVKIPKRDLDLYDIRIKDPLENQLLNEAMRKKDPKILTLTTNPGAQITATNGRFSVLATAPITSIDTVAITMELPYDGTWTLSIAGYTETKDVSFTKEEPSKTIAFFIPAKAFSVRFNGPDTVTIKLNGITVDTMTSKSYGPATQTNQIFAIGGTLEASLVGGGHVPETVTLSINQASIPMDLTWTRTLSLNITPNARYTIQYLGNGDAAGEKMFEDFIQSTETSYQYAIKVFGWWKITSIGVEVIKNITIDNVGEVIDALVRIKKTVTITANQNRYITIGRVGGTTPITTLQSPPSTDGSPTTVVWETYDAGSYTIGDTLTTKEITLAIEDTVGEVDITRKMNLPLLINGGVDVVMTDPFGNSKTINLPITEANPDGKSEVRNIEIWHNAGNYKFVVNSLYGARALTANLDVLDESTEVNTTGGGRSINFYCIRGYTNVSDANYYHVDWSGPSGAGSEYYHEAHYNESGQGVPGLLSSNTIFLYREGDYSFRVMPNHLSHSVHITFNDIMSELQWLD